MTVISQGVRAVSIAGQTTPGTPAATPVWHPKTTKGRFKIMPAWDVPDLLVYSRAVQREADPTTLMASFEGTAFLDDYVGYILLGLCGAPSTVTWKIGGATSDPIPLTVTKVNGMATAQRLYDGVVTRLAPGYDWATGRAMVEYRILGLATPEPFSAPTPTIPTSVIMRAGQTLVTKGGSPVNMITAGIEFTQPATPLYTSPTAVGSNIFTNPLVMESPGVYGAIKGSYPYSLYAGSSYAAALASTPEAWVFTSTRADVAGGHGAVITVPVVQPTDPDDDDDKPVVRQSFNGIVLYDTGIAGLATIALTGSTLSYATS